MKIWGLVCVTLVLVFLFLGAGCGNDRLRILSPPEGPRWPQYTYFDPAWSPKGEYIAYGYAVDPTRTPDTSGLYVYNTVDSAVVRLITSNVLPVQYDFSPDGRWIAFSWYYDIWKCLVSGDSLVRLTSGGQWDFSPAWSPDGQRIAYERKMYGIHIMNSDGSGDTYVVGGGYPQWLDDGRLVYIGLYCHIYVFDLESGVEERILERLPDWRGDSVRELDADGSGTRVLFSAFLPGEGPNVFRLDLATLRLMQLTATGGDQPAWSPDGSEIVYTNTYYGRIWLMSADGSNKRPLFTRWGNPRLWFSAPRGGVSSE